MFEQHIAQTTSERRAEHETKFVLPNRFSASIVSWLQSRCVPDPEHPAGIVSSIYTFHD